jgi:hypothetical protein
MQFARLSDETVGEAFFLGLQTAVSFGPFLDGGLNLVGRREI